MQDRAPWFNAAWDYRTWLWNHHGKNTKLAEDIRAHNTSQNAAEYTEHLNQCLAMLRETNGAVKAKLAAVKALADKHKTDTNNATNPGG